MLWQSFEGSLRALRGSPMLTGTARHRFSAECYSEAVELHDETAVLGVPDDCAIRACNLLQWQAMRVPAGAEPESAALMFEWNCVHNDGSAPNQLPSEYWISTVLQFGYGHGNEADAPSTLPGAGGQTALNTLSQDDNLDYVTNHTLWMGTGIPSARQNTPLLGDDTRPRRGDECPDPSVDGSRL